MNGEPRDLIVRPPVPLLLAVVAIGGLFYVLGQYIGSQPQRVQQEREANREITVDGRGEIDARPDIAQVTLGVTTGAQPTAKDAMELLSRRFDAVVAAVKSLGIKEDDIRTTNLSIHPQYDFSSGRQTLRGFEASESIEVKIRELGKIGEVLAKTTLEGVNQAGGISFALDDPEKLEEEAEEEAIQDARENAERLARALGVRLGSVKAYTSSTGEPPHPSIFLERAAIGGPGEPTGPPVPAGTQRIIANVSLTYELR